MVIDDWADTIARRGQVCRCRESAFPERSHLSPDGGSDFPIGNSSSHFPEDRAVFVRSHLSPERSHLSPDGGDLTRAAVHRLAADGYDSAADNASSLNVEVGKNLGKRR